MISWLSWIYGKWVEQLTGLEKHLETVFVTLCITMLPMLKNHQADILCGGLKKRVQKMMLTDLVIQKDIL